MDCGGGSQKIDIVRFTDVDVNFDAPVKVIKIGQK